MSRRMMLIAGVILALAGLGALAVYLVCGGNLWLIAPRQMMATA